MDIKSIKQESKLLLYIQFMVVVLIVILIITIGEQGSGTKSVCGNGILEPGEKNCCQDAGCVDNLTCLAGIDGEFTCQEAPKEDQEAHKEFLRLGTTLAKNVYEPTNPQALFAREEMNEQLDELNKAGYDTLDELSMYTLIVEHLNTISKANKINNDINVELAKKEVLAVYLQGANHENVTTEIIKIKTLANEAIALIAGQEERITLLTEGAKVLAEEMSFEVVEETEGYVNLRKGFEDIIKNLP